MKRRNIRRAAALACLVLAAVFFIACSGGNNAVTYEFTNVRVGSLERTVSSSGTINPVATVKVLPQMSGKVERIFVDYNDTVQKGDILAELNTDVLKLKREQQYASYIKAQANYELQMINYRNQEALAEKNLISEYDLKVSKTNLDNQAADLAVAESNLRVVETEINQYAYITSPIDGIVLDRRINEGDTVSESGTTAIFTLAENMREMQIEAGVAELDVSSITRGQPVRFTLESLPGRSFSGTVENIRMVPVVSSGVVSYTVMVKAENYDGSLLPGMTCAVDFIVERSEDVLMVSNSALRYQPTNLSADKIEEMVFNASLADLSTEQRQTAIDARNQTNQTRTQASGQNVSQSPNTSITGLLTGQGGGGRIGQIGGQFGGQIGGRQAAATGTRSQAAVVYRNIWYMNGEGKLDVMRIETGISNGTFTEIR
ncbi:MAG: efflux RND transporter periplasmic adaptor subunit, partial [Treponema sp.]|nr:efflux RND transporter periplasmic adaptor subunit [Treponema sp.]